MRGRAGSGKEGVFGQEEMETFLPWPHPWGHFWRERGVMAMNFTL